MLEALASFIQESKLDIELDLEAIADVIFLASVMPSPTARDDSPHSEESARETDEGTSSGSGQSTRSGPKDDGKENQQSDSAEGQEERQDEREERIDTLVEQSGDGTELAIYPRSGDAEACDRRGTPFRAPSASALPDALRIMRSLNPLKSKLSAFGIPVLDEEATAERSAELRHPVLVERIEPKRWLEAAIVLDDDCEAMVWRQTILEFAKLLQQHGAFRDIRVWLMDSEGRLRPISNAESMESSSNKVLHDPMGRRIVLLATTGRGKAFESGGTVSRLLADVLPSNPFAILHLLPPRLWHRSATSYPSLLLRSRKGKPLNQQLKAIQPPDPLGFGNESPGEETAFIPLLTLTPTSLMAYSRMMVGAGSLVPGISVDDISLPKTAAGVGSGAELVEQFGSIASVEAYRLVHHLASVPLTLPMMRMVQKGIEPEPTIAALAEILTSDLVETTKHRDEFEFRAGVREALYENIPRAATRLVQRAVSAYIYDKLGVRTDYDMVAENPSGAANVSEDARRFVVSSLRIRQLLGIGQRKSKESPWPDLSVLVDVPSGFTDELNVIRDALSKFKGVRFMIAEKGLETDLTSYDIWITVLGQGHTYHGAPSLDQALKISFLKRDGHEDESSDLAQARAGVRAEDEFWEYREAADIEEVLLDRLGKLMEPKGYLAAVSGSEPSGDLKAMAATFRRFGYRIEWLVAPKEEDLVQIAKRPELRALPTVFAFEGFAGRPVNLNNLEADEPFLDVARVARESERDDLALIVDMVGIEPDDLSPTCGLVLNSLNASHSLFEFVRNALVNPAVVSKSGLTLEFLWESIPPDQSLYATYYGSPAPTSRWMFDYSIALPGVFLESKQSIAWKGDSTTGARLRDLGLPVSETSDEATVSIAGSGTSDYSAAHVIFETPHRAIGRSETQLPISRTVFNLFHRVRALLDDERQISFGSDHLRIPGSSMRGMAWSDDGEELFLACTSGWARWKPGQRPLFHSGWDERPVTAIAVSGDTIAIGDDRYVRILDRASGDVISSIENPFAGEVEDLSIHGGVVGGCTREGTWIADRSTFSIIRSEAVGAISVAVVDDEHATALYGTEEGHFGVLDEEKQDEVALDSGSLNCIAVAHSADEIIGIGFADGTIMFGSPETYLAVDGCVVGISFNPTDGLAAVLTSNGYITVFDTSAWEKAYEFPSLHVGTGYGCVAFRPSTSILAVCGGGSSSVGLIDLSESKRLDAVSIDSFAIFVDRDPTYDLGVAKGFAWRGARATFGTHDLKAYAGSVFLVGGFEKRQDRSGALSMARIEMQSRPEFKVIVALRGDVDPRPEFEGLRVVRLPRDLTQDQEAELLLNALRSDEPVVKREVFLSGPAFEVGLRHAALAVLTRIANIEPISGELLRVGADYVQAIRTADAAIFLMSDRGGNGGTEREFRAAQEEGIHCIAFFLAEGKGRRPQAWETFRHQVRGQADVVVDLGNESELGAAIAREMNRLEEILSAPPKRFAPVPEMCFLIMGTGPELPAHERLVDSLRAYGMPIGAYSGRAADDGRLLEVLYSAASGALVFIFLDGVDLDQALLKRCRNCLSARSDLRAFVVYGGFTYEKSGPAFGPWSSTLEMPQNDVQAIIQGLFSAPEQERALSGLAQSIDEWGYGMPNREPLRSRWLTIPNLALPPSPHAPSRDALLWISGRDRPTETIIDAFHELGITVFIASPHVLDEPFVWAKAYRGVVIDAQVHSEVRSVIDRRTRKEMIVSVWAPWRETPGKAEDSVGSLSELLRSQGLAQARVPRRILVAGEGAGRINARVESAAKAVGRELALRGHILQTGPYVGVDHLVAAEFITTLKACGESIQERLEIYAEPNTRAPSLWRESVFGGMGSLFRAPQASSVSIDRCEAMIVIGGLGFPYKMAIEAVDRGLMVEPIAGTGGDADKLVKAFNLTPNPADMANPAKAAIDRIERRLLSEKGQSK